jgi:hypothetical protein
MRMGVQETEWLEYSLTPEELKPWKKKFDPILAIRQLKTVTELRSFLGSIHCQFYRDMYRKRSHILTLLLALLTSQSRQKTLPWTPECE